MLRAKREIEIQLHLNISNFSEREIDGEINLDSASIASMLIQQGCCDLDKANSNIFHHSCTFSALCAISTEDNKAITLELN